MGAYGDGPRLHAAALPRNRCRPRPLAHETSTMRMLIATVTGLLGFALYVMAAVALADRLPAAWLIQPLYFLIAGTLWAVPARWLMLWAAGMLGRNGRAA